MNFENQGVIKRLADQYGPENLTVILGNGEANGVEVFAETVTEGEPSYAGPLAGVALKYPSITYSREVMTVVPGNLRDEKLQLSLLVIDVEPMHQVLQASREKLTILNRSSRSKCSSRSHLSTKSPDQLFERLERIND